MRYAPFQQKAFKKLEAFCALYQAVEHVNYISFPVKNVRAKAAISPTFAV
jgi:hypothetical protein